MQGLISALFSYVNFILEKIQNKNKSNYGAGVGVGISVGDGVGVSVTDAVGVGVRVGVGVGVFVALGVFVGVGVSVGVFDGVIVGFMVGVGVFRTLFVETGPTGPCETPATSCSGVTVGNSVSFFSSSIFTVLDPNFNELTKLIPNIITTIRTPRIAKYCFTLTT